MVYFRKRRRLRVPVTLNVVLMSLNVVLMVLWIVFLAQFERWATLTVGTIAFSLILIGLVFYLVLTIKEIRLNQRQANFVDSVTHELKSPIASLQLYLETLQMRKLDTERREEFYRVMEAELGRLDQLISQLLEVGRLDAIGQESEPEDIDLATLLRKCAETACAHHKCSIDDVFSFDLQPAVINGRRLVLEMIFRNLLDNAIKYGAESPTVDVRVEVKSRGRVVTRISDNGQGVEPEIRKKIFRMFYRGGSELERTQKGTGLGLYIVRTLAHMLKGQVNVHDQADGQGSTFEVELPGRAAA
jgi:signal transduction histidine kinase